MGVFTTDRSHNMNDTQLIRFSDHIGLLVAINMQTLHEKDSIAHDTVSSLQSEITNQ